MLIELLLNTIALGAPTQNVWLVHRYDTELSGPMYRVATPDIYSRFFHYTAKDRWFGPMEHYWIGTDSPFEGDVYGIGCNADGTYMLITEIEPLEYPGFPMMIPGDYPHESMEVTLVDRNGNFAGKVFESEHLPQHLIDNLYFIRTTFLEYAPPINRIVSAPTDGQPIPDELWQVNGTSIDGVVRAYPCTDTVIYSSAPFFGLMRSDQQFITAPQWVHIEPLGGGYFAGYNIDRGVDLINCDGEVMFTLPRNSFVACRTAEGFAALMPDEDSETRGVLLNMRGQIIGEHPYGIGMQTLPGHLHITHGYLEEEQKIILWDNKSRAEIPMPKGLASIDFPKDRSGVFQFSRITEPQKRHARSVVGLMNPDATVRFQMRSTADPDVRWKHHGSIVRGAAMYQAHHYNKTTDENGTSMLDEIVYEYLINKDGKVLWKSPDAPDPMIEILNIED